MRVQAFKNFAGLLNVWLSAIVLSVMLTSASQARMSPAGLSIDNIASATYFNPSLGITETVYSNKVSARVLPVPALEVSGKSELFLSRGAFADHNYRLTNTGNTDLRISAWVEQASEKSMLQNAQLFIDLNTNGKVDASEPVFASGDTRMLEMGRSLQLIYTFQVSNDVQVGTRALSPLMVDATADGTPAEMSKLGDATGEVEIIASGLQIEKSLARTVVQDGELLTYKIRLRNNAEEEILPYSTIDDEAVIIDGKSTAGILVRDAVPLQTVFTTVGKTADMIALYHRAGDARHTYTTTAPDTLENVDAVAFFHEGGYPVGKSTDLDFTVFLASKLGTVNVSNIAETFIPYGAKIVRIPSNEVMLQNISDISAALSFINPLTGLESKYADVDQDIQIGLTAGACNISAGVDTVSVEVVSAKTRDFETVSAVETGPNTGVFISPNLPLAKMSTPRSDDGVLATTEGDTLTSTVRCGGLVLSNSLEVSPGAFAFNSVTNAVVEGAKVVLLNAQNKVVARATSNQLGYFTFGSMPAGEYTMDVTPPKELSFPSIQKVNAGFGRRTTADASYGRKFSHAGGPLRLIDVPLDPFYGIPITLDKKANKTKVQSGGFVVYTLEAGNSMNQALMHAKIKDRLPADSSLVSGSVTLDGVVQADPVLNDDGVHIYPLGTIPPLESRELQYIVRFAPTRRSGNRVNSAVLSGIQSGLGVVHTSVQAAARVKLNAAGGVFSREATVLGTVFLDCNENGIRDEEDETEIGVPGVRLVTQEGLFVVTDRDGKYSLFGLRPVSHVFALQSSTLPKNAKPMVSRAADMMRAGSRMIALKHGEVRAEDFPLKGCSPAARAEVAARVQKLSDRTDGDANMLSDLPIDASQSDRRSVRTEAGLPTVTQMFGASIEPTASATPAAQKEATKTLEEIIKTFDKKFEFIGLVDGARTIRPTISVRAKGPADLEMRLELNGKEVNNSRVGEHVTWAGGNVQAKEYVAIRLNTGTNILTLKGVDPFGNVRKTTEITLIAPGEPEKIELIAPDRAPASPGSSVPVIVRVLDARGVPVQAAAVVTLSARVSRWDVADIREDQPGIQAYVDNGEATFSLFAPQVAGTDTITVKGGLGTAKAEILFTPDLDERIMVGIIEGSVGLNGATNLIKTDELNAFESTTTGLRGELYLKGRIRGDALLTLRYSSDRDTEDRLFSDIRSDEYYPIYGDNSERGFDAQSSSNLYVKVEKEASYILYGDIAIDAESDSFELGGYRDVTTGAKAHWEDEKVEITVFAAYTAQQSRTVEIEGRGISGPYDIDLTDYREGSERVELLTRDRNTGDIIKTQSLRRLSDYVLDYFHNSIVFDLPVSQADEDGNPISIRIVYQTEENTKERYWLYGAEASAQLSEKTKVGARVVISDAPKDTDQRYRIYAAYVKSEISANATIEAEIAQSENGEGVIGNAARIAYDFKTKEAGLRIEATTADEGFQPPGSSARAGTNQLSVEYDRQINEKTSFTASAAYTADKTAGTEQITGEIGTRRVIDETLSRTDGLRFSKDLHSDDDIEVSYVIGADWRPASTPNVKLGFQLDAPFTHDQQGTLRINGDYRVSDELKIFGSVELSFGELGNTMTRANLGLDYRMNEWLEGRTEITTDDNGTSKNARVTQGLSSKIELNERTSLRFSLEYSQTLGESDSYLTSLALGGKWQSEDEKWIAEGSIDQTFEAEGYTLYTDFGIAGEIQPDLTMLARSRFALDQRGTGVDRRRHRMRVGAAYRPTGDDRLNVLAWYEHRLEQGALREEDHLWSIAGTWDADPRLRLNAKYAGHYSSFDGGFASGEVKGLVQLVQGGATWEAIPNRLEASLNAYHMWDDQGYSNNALGLELGYVVDEGTMISVGYNHSSSQVPMNSELYQEGIYVRVRFLLDDSLWDKLDNFFGG